MFDNPVCRDHAGEGVQWASPAVSVPLKHLRPKLEPTTVCTDR
jgi:hypothetical protein